jgi:hypothetical protein
MNKGTTMKLPTLGELVKGDKTAYLQYWNSDAIWYKIDDFEFPVDELKGGTFHAEEKPITLMRWIRKHLDYLKEAISDQH